MPCCFVPRCRSGYHSEVTRDKISFFSPPESQLAAWNKRIPRKDRQLKKTDKVCSRHFNDYEIEKYYETKLRDGTISKIPRDRWKLTKDAIPSRFPGCPSYLSTIISKKPRLSPKKRKNVEIPPKKRRNMEKLAVTESHSRPEANYSNIDEVVHETVEEPEFLWTAHLPPLWTHSSVTPNLVALLRWSENYSSIQCRVNVEVENNKITNTRFFLCDTEVMLRKYSKLVSFEQLLEILGEVEKLTICASKLRNDCCAFTRNNNSLCTRCANSKSKEAK